MRYEHLVQVNDPLLPLLDPLSRGQLWRGLAQRAEQPAAFMPGLDRCVILERRENYLKRELHFGSVIFVDHVHLLPQQRIRFDSDLADPHAGSSLVISIEEPQPGLLWTRFVYQTKAANEADDDPQCDAARKAAYLEADTEAIRQIRAWASEGTLGD